MNRNDIVRAIADSQRGMEAEKESKLKRQEADESQDRMLGHLADMLDGHAELLTERTQAVRVLNQPKRMEVGGKVSLAEADEITAALEDVENSLSEALESAKKEISEAVREHRSVTVDNFEVPRIPEPPKHVTASVDALPKYVGEKLDDLKKAVKALDLSVTVQPTPVSLEPTDLSPLLSSLKALETSLSSLIDKEPVTVESPDFSALEERVEALGTLLEAVVSNTGVQTSQTFRSSWDKSLHMQSLDAAATTVWKTVNGTRVVDYLEFTDKENVTWRKTYSYDDTTAEVNSWTAWTRQ